MPRFHGSIRQFPGQRHAGHQPKNGRQAVLFRDRHIAGSQAVEASRAGAAMRSTVIDDRVNGTAPLVHTRTSTGKADGGYPMT